MFFFCNYCKKNASLLCAIGFTSDNVVVHGSVRDSDVLYMVGPMTMTETYYTKVTTHFSVILVAKVLVC